MHEYPLSTSASVVLGASGGGTVTLTPQVGQTWKLASVAIRVTTNTAEPTFKLYIGGAATDDALVDGTYTGSLNSSAQVAGRQVTAGQKVIGVWSSGDTGATATLTVYGTVVTRS